MIYLIGGAPRCGKTIFAKQLSKKFSIPRLSTDTLERIAHFYTPSKELPRKFPKNAIRSKTKNSNDSMYSQYTAKQIVSAYVKQARATWPIIETVLACEPCEDRSIIIEGHHIHPQLVKKFIKKYGIHNIKGVFIVKSNPKKIINNCIKFSTKDDWFVNKTKDKTTYIKIANMLVEFGDFYMREAKKYNQKIYNTETNFKNKLLEIQRYLIK